MNIRRDLTSSNDINIDSNRTIARLVLKYILSTWSPCSSLTFHYHYRMDSITLHENNRNIDMFNLESVHPFEDLVSKNSSL
jgi:hypothetical protein